MRILLDTNVLLRISDKDHASHGTAVSAVEMLEAAGHEGAVVPQVLYEYWVVATRPIESNGLGADPITVEADLDDWAATFRLLLDERGVYTRWRSLVSDHAVKGKNAHDARLVAAMQRHGLTNLLTFNKQDFTRFTGIQVYTPDEILGGQVPA
jgi:predicted nucleic acid-binding protein